MRVLNDICNNLEYQLEDIVKKGDMTPTELDLVYKSVKTIYYIHTIKAMDEYSDDGYSRGHYDTSRGMDHGYSYRRGRYSRDTEHDGVMKELGDMMARSSSDIERQTIAKLMDKMSS